MTRISSTSTAFYKKGFPVVWFGFLGVFVALAATHDAPIIFLLIPCFMSVLGYFLMRKLVWDPTLRYYRPDSLSVFMENGIDNAGEQGVAVDGASRRR